MKINPDKCVACGNCTYVCPMGAIYIDQKIHRATINRDECVECYACFNGLSQEHLNPVVRPHRSQDVSDDCASASIPSPTSAPPPPSSRTNSPGRASSAGPSPIRGFLTNRRASTAAAPRKSKPTTSAARVKVGEVGFTIEFGRPGVGVRFRDIQKMCTALGRAGVAFEKKNPVTSLMTDVATGAIREDILDEKVLSAIVEIKVPVERTEEIIRLVWDVEKQIETVVALGVGVRCDEHGEENVVAPILERLGYKLERAKTNIGLGRITNPRHTATSARNRRREMTNTLHRFGRRRKFPRRLRRLRHVQQGPERSGFAAEAQAISGARGLRSSPSIWATRFMAARFAHRKNMTPASHWHRDTTPDFAAVIDGLDRSHHGRRRVR